MHTHGAMAEMPPEFSIIAIILFGLAASFGHCAGMCAPIVLAYSSAKMRGLTLAKQYLGHIFYLLGRLCSYALLGFAAGLAGEALKVDPGIRRWFMIALGAFLLLMGVLSLAGSRFSKFLESGAIAGSSWYGGWFSALFRSGGMASFYGIGVLNGFLPCGMVYNALAMSLAAPNAAVSAISMSAFAVATAPSLLLVGAFAGFFSNPKIRSKFEIASALVLAAFGAFIIYGALNMNAPKPDIMPNMGGAPANERNMDMPGHGGH